MPRHITQPVGAAVGGRRFDGPSADGLIRSGSLLAVTGGLVLLLVAALALREVASLFVPVLSPSSRGVAGLLRSRVEA